MGACLSRVYDENSFSRYTSGAGNCEKKKADILEAVYEEARISNMDKDWLVELVVAEGYKLRDRKRKAERDHTYHSSSNYRQQNRKRMSDARQPAKRSRRE